jgi:putative CocE/NonD family hydrolase
MYLRGQLLRWFDHWLKGVDNGIDTEPRVSVAPERTANWSQTAIITADTFPLPGTTDTTYFFNKNQLSTLSAAGNVQKIPPTNGGNSVFSPIRRALGGSGAELGAAFLLVNDLLNSDAGIMDSRLATQSDDSANARTFASPPLPANVTATGLPTFHLFVSAKASDANYYAQIFERLPNGTMRLVTRGAFSDHASSPNTPHQVDFSPFAINHVFKAGDSIVVRVASRDFPFFLPNLSQPTVKLYRDSTHPSNVTLPVTP